MRAGWRREQMWRKIAVMHTNFGKNTAIFGETLREKVRDRLKPVYKVDKGL